MSNKAKLKLTSLSCFGFILLVFGCFMMYSCDHKPIIPPNNNFVENNHAQIHESKEPANNSRIDNFPEFYLNQITSFYQQLITILLSVIGILLVVSFLYFNFTSRIQAADMAHEALQAEPFKIALKDAVNKRFTKFKNTDPDFGTILDKQSEFEERIIVLEKALYVKSYENAEEVGKKQETSEQPVASAPKTEGVLPTQKLKEVVLPVQVPPEQKTAQKQAPATHLEDKG